MKIGTENYRKLTVALLLAVITLVAGRGLLRTTPLAGHDAPAYPVNQAQFMENLREGVLFPRWSPDTRYGYGQPRLQFRPPLLHYLASPLHAATGNPFLALHLVLLVGLFLAAWGAYALARLRVGTGAALAAAAGFVGANYLVADLYLRGAYYEVLASAALPWILWAQSRENIFTRRARLVGPLAWAALLMSHPAVAFFFTPLAAAHALAESRLAAKSGCARRWYIAGWSAAFLGIGVLLSAPYTWVMLAERPWVRLEIFLTDLDSWRRHFFSLREWFSERWPETYVEYRGFDYLQRARHPEMRGLNYWAMAVLVFAPPAWWLTLRNWRRDGLDLRQLFTSPWGEVDSDRVRGLKLQCSPSPYPLPRERDQTTNFPSEILFWSIFFYAATWISVALSLRLSLPIWNQVAMMDTFNFPWRVLTVASLCLALAAAYGVALLGQAIERRGLRLDGLLPGALLILAALAEVLPHSGGWNGPAWLTPAELAPDAIRKHAGIPLQYYTPTWVRRYATEPAPIAAQVVEGIAKVTVAEHSPTRWRLQVEATTSARIALAHYYYPGWRIHRPDGKVSETEPWGERALISFSVPVGAHELEARFGSTPARRAANGAFVLGLALLVAAAWLLGRRRAMDRQAINLSESRNPPLAPPGRG